jgi:hypothetical protein
MIAYRTRGDVLRFRFALAPGYLMSRLRRLEGYYFGEAVGFAAAANAAGVSGVL